MKSQNNKFNLNPQSDLIHMIGIGGIGMSGLAEILISLGFKLQGSDLISNRETKLLQEKGAKIFEGHNAENLGKATFVIRTIIAKQDNVECQEATRRNIPMVTRTEMLGELIKILEKTTIAISGSHGKTTTTGVTANIFEVAGLDPTVLTGGIINSKQTNAYLGKGDFFIVEADESDRTFIKIPYDVAVITNIDTDHIENYENDFEQMKDAYRVFIKQVPSHGFCVACLDDPPVRQVVNELKDKKVITYGIDSEDAHVRACNITLKDDCSVYDIVLNLPSQETVVIEKVRMPFPGRHYVLNSLACFTVGYKFSSDVERLKQGIQSYGGTYRRFTKIAEFNGGEVIDDKSAHPNEIKATLTIARQIVDNRNGKLHVMCLPHGYTRVYNFYDGFFENLSIADKIYMLEVYDLKLKPIEGKSSQSLVQDLKKAGKEAYYIEDQTSIASVVATHISKGDIFLMISADKLSRLVKDIDHTLKTQFKQKEK